MKVDLYTKVVLTIIALALSFNFLKPVWSPTDVEAKGGGKFDHLQFSVSIGGIALFDSRTGVAWLYEEVDKPARKFTLIEPGNPWEIQK